MLNGGERSFLTVAERLIACGWSYVAAVPRGSSFEKALQRIGIRNVGLTTHLPDGDRLSQIELRDQIAGLVVDVQPCLIHANSLSMSRIVGPLDVGVPSVGYLRDILKLSKKPLPTSIKTIELSRYRTRRLSGMCLRGWVPTEW